MNVVPVGADVSSSKGEKSAWGGRSGGDPTHDAIVAENPQEQQVLWSAWRQTSRSGAPDECRWLGRGATPTCSTARMLGLWGRHSLHIVVIAFREADSDGVLVAGKTAIRRPFGFPQLASMSLVSAGVRPSSRT